MPATSIDGVVRMIDGTVRSYPCPACCDKTPPPECPFWWRAEICSLPYCPAPSYIFVCSTTPNADGSGPIQPGCVIKDYGHCYTVDGSCKWVKGTPGPGECKIPANAVYQNFASYFCLPNCNAGGCEPVSGWLHMVPCGCAPQDTCTDLVPIQLSNAFVTCEDYFNHVNAGYPCPTSLVTGTSGQALCAKVDVGLGIVPVLPPGATVYGLTNKDCCACCDGLHCHSDYNAPHKRQENCDLVVNEQVRLCCNQCNGSVEVNYRATNYTPSNLNAPPGITPGTKIAIDTTLIGTWTWVNGVASGTVTMTTTQYQFVGDPIVTVFEWPPQAGPCAFALFSVMRGPQQLAPDCAESGFIDYDSRGRYTADINQMSPGPPGDFFVARRDVGYMVRRSGALGRCGGCGGLQALPAPPKLPPGGGESVPDILARLASLGVRP